jgi:hypothetical protein
MSLHPPIRINSTTTHITLHITMNHRLLSQRHTAAFRTVLLNILRNFKSAKRVTLLNFTAASFQMLKWETWRINAWRGTLSEFENVGVEFVFETRERIEVPNINAEEET